MYQVGLKDSLLFMLMFLEVYFKKGFTARLN